MFIVRYLALYTLHILWSQNIIANTDRKKIEGCIPQIPEGMAKPNLMTHYKYKCHCIDKHYILQQLQ